MKISQKELQHIFEIREFAYSLLKEIYYGEPTIELISTLKENKDIYKSFPFRQEDSLINDGIELVEKYLKNDLAIEKIHEELHSDYTRLFIGPRSLLAPPWESAYLNEEGLLFQEETLNVRRAYLKYNLIPQKYPNEADDHIGLELDFINRLSHVLLKKLTQEENLYGVMSDLKSFIENHLLRWIPSFTKEINFNAKTDFYRGFSMVLQGFLQVDFALLEELTSTEEINGATDVK